MTNTSNQVGNLTFINVWNVEPENQQPLLELFREIISTVMQKQPGFISAKLHASLDGKQVVVYAQWQSLADWQKNLENPEVNARLEQMKKLGNPMPNLYTTAYTTHT